MSNAFTQVEADILREMLVNEISGGSDAVHDVLREQSNIVWLMAENSSPPGACAKDLVYLQAQLSMIELAQGVVRNHIDTSSARANSEGAAKYDAYNERHAKSQRVSQGTSCSWSSSTSFQQFLRDSESHDRSQGDSFNTRQATSFEVGYDRSRQQASGYASSFDDASTRVDGDGFGFSHFDNYHRSASYSCTGDMAGNGNSAPNVDNATLPELGDINFSPAQSPFAPPWLPYEPLTFNTPFGPFTLPGISVPNFANWNLTGWFQNEINSFWKTGIAVTMATPEAVKWATLIGSVANISCPSSWSQSCANISSGGRQGSARTAINISIPFIDIDFRIEWTESAGWDQDYVCTRGQTFTKARSNSHLDYTQENSASNTGRSESHDQSTTAKDVSRHGEAHSNGQSKSDSVASGVMDSRGNSRSGADRSAHSEGQSSGQSTAEMRSHAESEGSEHSAAQATAEFKAYGQLFDNLQEMWQRVFHEIKDAYRRRAANQAPAVGKWQRLLASKSIACAPAHAAFIERSNNLCVRTGCSCGGGGCSSCGRGSRYGVPGHADSFAPLPTVRR